jgi:outer membrane protein assembly factor BamB
MTPMSADRFLDRLEQTGLLEAWFLQTLRDQAAASPTPPTADSIAKRLVRSGHLTKLQASKLLADLEDDKAEPPAAPKKPAPGSGKPADSRGKAKPAASIDEELGLAPLGDEPDLGLAPLPGDASATPAEDEEVVLLEDASQAAPASGRPASQRPLAEPAGLRPLRPVAGLQPLEPVGGLQPLDAADGLQPLDAAAGLQPLADTGGLQALDEQSLSSGGLQEPSDALQKGARRGPKKRASGSPWDSTLMYAGGGGLVLLLIIGLVLWYTLTRGTAAELLQAADEAYRSGSYSQAIPNYERFLDSYPDDPNVSLARVRIGTARIRQVLEGSKDKQPALRAVEETLPTIENEAAFDEARAELASILPEIAEGFSQPAKTEPDMKKAQALVDLAEQAMKLVNNPGYIPTSLRKPVETRIENITEDIELAKRNINQSKRLAEAVADIRQAVQAGNTVEAYTVRRRLLGEYPGLDQNAQLVEAVLAIAQRERDLVKAVEDPVAAATEDHPSAAEFRVALASRRGAGKPGNDQQMVCFLARGSIYGLQASTGQLKWRRGVGYDTLANPQPLARQPGADVIAVDSQHQELLRLKGETGQLVWRTPLGERFCEPVVKGAQILVATQGGRVLDIDAETGNATGQVKIPQALQIGPGPSDKGHLYQVGEHSNVYVLDEATLECKEVYYLGHKPGSVAAPPVLALGHLFLVENSGADFSDMHVLATDANGLALKPAIKPIRLQGRVQVPLLLNAARVLVVTDLGAIRVFEVNTANAKTPVADIVEPVVASYKTAVTGYPVFDSGRLWVGDERFTKYDVQTSRNRLIRQWIKDERDVFVAPPQVIGDTVYHLRRRKDSPAYTAAAIAGEDGKVLWEVDLAVPAALLTVDMERKQVHSISAQAELFELTPEVFQAGVVDQAAAAAGSAARGKPFTEVQAMDQGRWALAGAGERGHVVVYDPNAATPDARLRDVLLKAAGTAQVAATPVFGLGGLIAPLDNGQVLLLDPATGDNKLLPFQPTVEAGSKIAWQRAAVVGSDQREFVIADNRRKLFRVGVKDQPEPHLAELAQVQLDVDIVSPPAAVGDTVYGVIRGANSDTVLSFGAADLAAGKEWPAEGRIIWGPETVNDLVLVATDRQTLVAFEAGQKQRWTSPLSHGALVGRPLPVTGNLLLASLSGTVWMISGQDGKELTKAEVGEPLGAGPVAFANGSRLLVSAADGTLLVIRALAAP